MIQEKIEGHKNNLNNCSFCACINKDKGVTPLFAELFPRLPHRRQILAETKNWFLIPDDSPLVEDHLLIIPKKHLFSCAWADEESKQDLIRLKSKLMNFLLSYLSIEETIFVFEHGAGLMGDSCIAPSGQSGGHNHAHLHILPVPRKRNGEILPVLGQQIRRILKCNPKVIGSLNEFPKISRPYLYIEESGVGLIFFPTKSELERFIHPQFLRRLVGEYLSLSDKDWNYLHIQKDHRDLARKRIRKTLEKFSLFL